MKKILFSAVDMNIGGIETSLLTLLNMLSDKKEYDITLVLENKQGVFLKELDENINVIEYKPSNNKIVVIRKIINLIKRINFSIKYKNKFDFVASYATYSKMASYVARTASSNNSLWVHSDYTIIYKNDLDKMDEFFSGIKANKFKHIIMVSKASYNAFVARYSKLENVTTCIGNLINYHKIENLAKKEVDIKKEYYTFLTVGRHDEKEKRLTRVIDASKKLVEDGYNFRVWFVGEGKDTKMYEDLINEKGLQEYIKLLGVKKNPYPYYEKADAVLLTSDYEGYPVVFQESFVLNKPIITTDVSDALEEVQGKFGMVTSKNIDDIYVAMKEFIQNGYEIREEFNAIEYNKEKFSRIEEIMEEI